MKKKTKVTPRFALVRRGYDVASVEAYIGLEREKADKAGAEQRERIRALTEKCDRLNAELADYRSREGQIKNALISATEQAERTTLDVKFRYAMELNRLQVFRAKWTSAYEEIKERYKFGGDALNMESVALSVKIELEKFLSEEFSINRDEPRDDTEAAFRDEAERLGASESKVEELRRKLCEAVEKKNGESREVAKKSAADDSAADSLGDFFPRTYSASVAPSQGFVSPRAKDCGESGFSLSEACNPTESLAEICSYLGLGRRQNA